MFRKHYKQRDYLAAVKVPLMPKGVEHILKSKSSLSRTIVKVLGVTSYSYDGDGRRVKKVTGSPAVTTIYVYDAMGKLVAEYNDAQQQPAGGTKYLTADHLGSTRIVTGQNQAVVARYDYLPFGEEIGAGVGSRTVQMGYGVSDTTRQKFTSKERDAESGLDYFGARYFSSVAGRFTGIDPYNIILEVKATTETSPEKAKLQFLSYLCVPQQWNGYTYVTNNPLKYIDPSGEIIELTGNEEERKRAFQRLKDLAGPEGANLLYLREENGHYYVEYNGDLASSGDLGTAIAEAIDSSVITEYHVTTNNTVTDRLGRTINLQESGGGKTIGFGADGQFTRIQIFVHVNADKIATHSAREHNAVGDDGNPLVYYNDVADAHEFGHGQALLKVGFRKGGLIQSVINSVANEVNNANAVRLENVARQRRGLNRRTNH